MGLENITIRGAREHNLKEVDLELPRNRLIVITGVSGSGKSSLAFDTIYAEGQRRYVESLSAYARQFLEQMDKPDVDFIEGLSPAISIEQKASSKNPRSTVGTITEIYDYLRLLYARVGQPYCYKCGRKIEAQSVQEITDSVLGLAEGTRLQVLAPLITERKGEYQKLFSGLLRQGFLRVKVDGQVHDLNEVPALDKKKKHTIEVVVDRLIIKEGVRSRLAESIELSLRLSDGLVKVDLVDEADPKKRELFFSSKRACVTCGVSYPELTPQLFSFNSPQGACPTCLGLGVSRAFDPELIVPDPALSIREGAIHPWRNYKSVQFLTNIDTLAKHLGIDLDTPWAELPDKAKQSFLYGTGSEKVTFYFERNERRHFFEQSFEGVIPQLERRERENPGAAYVREEMEKYMAIRPCPDCQGARLRAEARHVKIGGLPIHEVGAFSVARAEEHFQSLKLTEHQLTIARRILKEIEERLGFLVNVGLDYLTLDRVAGSLSGGESQRIRLATQIGSALVGVLYILDEPSIGLHQRDNRRLLETLCGLRDLGNTVIVVEHDADTIMTADYIVDMGPGAGEIGGELVFAGPPEGLIKSESLTGRYLSGRDEIPVPAKRRQAKGWLEISGAQLNNLKSIDASFPLGCLTAVTGVSGSGKSSLVLDTLYRALSRQLHRSKQRPGPFDRLKGLRQIDKVIDIDQSPIGRTPRSNPATYTGVFSPIRELFTRLPDSKMRGYKPGRFSFNVPGGRCEACQGDGIIKIEMHFLPDVYVKCDLCRGKRYNRETLEIKYKGQTIADVLDMTVSQALRFFEAVPPIQTKLTTLREVGLGYIKLGQPATTLSGGEAQRIKLAKELSRRDTGRTLYILDEPTTGLHFDDIKKLLNVLNSLIEKGNTVIVIEHNLEVIKTADHVIDLGPEGGDSGGHIVAAGSPEDIARNGDSYTGRFLKGPLGI